MYYPIIDREGSNLKFVQISPSTSKVSKVDLDSEATSGTKSARGRKRGRKPKAPPPVITIDDGPPGCRTRR